jgi:secernin
MCDSVVSVGADAVWLAKNSDREPDEVQVVESHPAGVTVPIDGGVAAHAMIVSRPLWLWGCEMGVNERGVAVANEAVFTRVRLADRGVTGMDLQRLALARAGTAEAAVDSIVEGLARWPQGGRMGHRDRGMRYSSSFLVADRREAWVLETAGAWWAAQRVRGARTISNALTIEADFDRIHPDAFAVARSRGWCRGANDFGFARCFGRRDYRALAGAVPRRACTHARLTATPSTDVAGLAALLRDHAGGHPADGWRMIMPCAHASWLPTRSSGQTTASMIACLASDGPRAWFTGTSSPCLGIFKPVHFGAADPLARLPAAGERPDADSLWWRHERLHRAVLADHAGRSAALAGERAALEARALAADAADADAVAEIWELHRTTLPRWTELALAAGCPGRGLFHRFWARRAREVLGG